MHYDITCTNVRTKLLITQACNSGKWNRTSNKHIVYKHHNRTINIIIVIIIMTCVVLLHVWWLLITCFHFPLSTSRTHRSPKVLNWLLTPPTVRSRGHVPFFTQAE